MREYTAELNGKELTLQANFKASVRLAREVGDPLMIAREAALEAYMLERGINYQPKWGFTVENLPKIISIGLEAAGSRLKQSEIEDLIFEAGFPAARDFATGYVALIVGPQPEVMPESEDDSEGNQLGLAS